MLSKLEHNLTFIGTLLGRIPSETHRQLKLNINNERIKAALNGNHSKYEIIFEDILQKTNWASASLWSYDSDGIGTSLNKRAVKIKAAAKLLEVLPKLPQEEAKAAKKFVEIVHGAS